MSPTLGRAGAREAAAGIPCEAGRAEHAATQAPVSREDPARMTPGERRAELGALLAEGFRRLSLNQANAVACGPQPEPRCEPDEAVDSLENRSSQS